MTHTDEQVDAVYQWICQDLLPAFDVSTETACGDVELWENTRAALSAMPAPDAQAIQEAVERAVLASMDQPAPTEMTNAQKIAADLRSGDFRGMPDISTPGSLYGEDTPITVTGSSITKDQPASSPVSVATSGIYVASKAKYGHEWVALREQGVPIISTWIYESAPGATLDWPDLWTRCVNEAKSAAALVVICRPGDILKGAWVEVGAALGAGIPVFGSGCEEFSVSNHPLFTNCASEAEAFGALTKGDTTDD